MKFSFLKDVPKRQTESFFIERWGSTDMIVSTGCYRCEELDGFACFNQSDELVGLVTFSLSNNGICEIISLDSVSENKGIGSALLEKVEEWARAQQCRTMKLITTNDNIHALSFYQKRGYALTAILKDAVGKARLLKPEIPLIADNGIPIRDEWEMRKELGW